MRARLTLWMLGGVATDLLRSAPCAAECGDGVLEDPAEECDDANDASNDGCSEACRLECNEVGELATQHTCLHAAFGPFEEVAAQEFPGFVFASIDSLHTFYTLGLAGTAGASRSQVTYWPTVNGAHAVYTDREVPVEVLNDADLSPVEFRFEHAVSACENPEALRWVRVYDLSADAPYVLVFGPTQETTVKLAVERLEGLSQGQFFDTDDDGFGADDPAIWSWCPLPGRVTQAGDCDDQAPTTHPGADELCNGVDDDCNPETLESCEPADAGVDGGGVDDAGHDAGDGDAQPFEPGPDAGSIVADAGASPAPVPDVGDRDGGSTVGNSDAGDGPTAQPSVPAGGSKGGCSVGADAPRAMGFSCFFTVLLALLSRRRSARSQATDSGDAIANQLH